MRFSLALSFIAVLMPTSVKAQDNIPQMPDALQVLVDRGAQARYLGTRHGMAGWVTIFQGQEQYYYTTPDGEGFVMGLLFDKDGTTATISQVRDLQSQGEGVLNFLAVASLKQLIKVWYKCFSHFSLSS